MEVISQLNDHVSINKIKGRYLQIILYAFTFNQASLEDVQREIMNLDVEKSSSSKSIPATILTNSTNQSLLENTFPNELKQSEVIPWYKKLNPYKEKNYVIGL